MSTRVGSTPRVGVPTDSVWVETTLDNSVDPTLLCSVRMVTRGNGPGRTRVQGSESTD